MQLDEATSNVLAMPNVGLNQLIRGIEKESLRVRPDGSLSQQPHPKALGSALTHRAITTDFSEAQLELITGIHPSPEGVLKELSDIHVFVQKNIGDELIWPNSMPCILAADQEKIPLGQYGSSNIAQAKTVYRRGLGNRYGRLMQTISGIHYNFSIPNVLWEALGKTTQDSRTEAYFGLIRNFRRWSWLLLYLFGAAPAVCRSFVRGTDHKLEPFSEGTYYLPHATSLRMGRLGYQSEAQSALDISYNSVADYSRSMSMGLTESYPDYSAIMPAEDGEYPQLNDAVLQIENEFYGTIRPKRTTQSGERPLSALNERGVEYVEVRCVDLNPLSHWVLTPNKFVSWIRFYFFACWQILQRTQQIKSQLGRNQTQVVERGREPGLQLEGESGLVGLTDWGNKLLDACAPIAAALDQASGDSMHQYRDSLGQQRDKLAQPQLTPSAKIIAAMAMRGSFFKFTMDQAEQVTKHLAATPITDTILRELEQESAASLLRQAEIEEADTQPFSEFLEGYLALP